MDAFIDTFHIDWRIIIAQAVNFLVVLAILYYLVLKPLKKTMTARTGQITEGLLNAKQSKELIQKSQEEYDSALVNAKTEANAIFQEAKKQAEAKKMEMLEQAKAQVELMILNGQKSLEAEKQKIIQEARKEIVELTINATSKILAEHGAHELSPEAISKIKSI